MHHAIWGQIDGLKRAEIHQGYLLVVCPVFCILTAAPTKGAVEKELRACIPHQAISSQVKVTYHIEFSNRVWIVGERRQNDDNLLHKTGGRGRRAGAAAAASAKDNTDSQSQTSPNKPKRVRASEAETAAEDVAREVADVEAFTEATPPRLPDGLWERRLNKSNAKITQLEK